MTHITIHLGFYIMWSGWVTTHSHSCLGVRLSIKRSTWGMFSVPKDPIPLCHYGLKETKVKGGLDGGSIRSTYAVRA